MLVSELKRNGKQILLDCFKPVLNSPDKELWQKALSFMQSRINLMQRTLGDVCVNHSDDAGYLIRSVWEWSEAHRQLSQMYGQRFVIPALKARHSHTQALYG